MTDIFFKVNLLKFKEEKTMKKLKVIAMIIAVLSVCSLATACTWEEFAALNSSIAGDLERAGYGGI
jgi:uncharacterized membrane protein YqhA